MKKIEQMKTYRNWSNKLFNLGRSNFSFSPNTSNTAKSAKTSNKCVWGIAVNVKDA